MSSTPLKTAPHCYGCGAENPAGLALAPTLDDDGRVRAQWTPRREHRGLSHITHGGVLTAACDEMMGFALTVLPLHGRLFVTTKLEMRFVRPVPLEMPVTLEAWHAGGRGTQVFTRCRILGPNGKEHAVARATFVEVPEHLRQHFARGG
jgi:acyl-coenzyme A thioesterase PaaI-like protein